MNKEIKIRLGQEKDLDAVMEINKLALKQLWSIDQYRRELSLPNSRFWLLCLNDSQTNTEEIVGMGCSRVIASNIEIPFFAIHPNYQSKGFGQYFFAWLLDSLTHHQLRYTRLEVKESNQKAIDFYQKFDFQIINKSVRNYKSNQENGYQMMSPSLISDSFQQNLNTFLEDFSENLQQQGFTITKKVKKTTPKQMVANR